MNNTALGVVIGLFVAAAAWGATEVDIKDFAFVPATVVIEKGEDVKWTKPGPGGSHVHFRHG